VTEVIKFNLQIIDLDIYFVSIQLSIV